MTVRQHFPKFDSDDFFLMGNEVADFGPPLPYTRICDVYSVEKMSLYVHHEGDLLEAVPIKVPYHPKARLQGSLYRLTEEDILDLDKAREVGLLYDRKRVPVLIPYLDERSQLTRINAYVYVGVRSSWEDQINYGLATNRSGKRVLGKQPFELAQTVPHPTALLNGRFTFVDYGEPTHRPVYLTNEMIEYVDRKNTNELLRMHFLNAQRAEEDIERMLKEKRQAKWASIKRKLKAFVE